jgi:murein DD-endopeptidase MepM/ murein hydrolase activator NlpD
MGWRGPHHLYARAKLAEVRQAGADRDEGTRMTRAISVPADLRAWFAQTWLTLGVALLAASGLHAGARAAGIVPLARTYDPVPAVAATVANLTSAPAPQKVLVWSGADVDGDGAADFANPTGRRARTTDAYGHGYFGASRDGGVREHEGVDWIAEAGQEVVAPISGFVTKIGFAYANAPELKFVEITNPALGYVARVFYVDPIVRVGQALRVGEAIGHAHSLQAKYPGGMTDHVHMELAGPNRLRFDSSKVLTARYVDLRDAG